MKFTPTSGVILVELIVGKPTLDLKDTPIFDVLRMRVVDEGYNSSSLRKDEEIIVSVDANLFKADPEQNLYWIHEKSVLAVSEDRVEH